MNRSGRREHHRHGGDEHEPRGGREHERAPGKQTRSAMLHRKINGEGVADGAAEQVERAASSSGSPLPQGLQRKFEASLGADLSGVRVHTGTESAGAAQSVSARAYTVGADIHFGAGQYNPGSRDGEALLAHEVAHTVQQSGGGAHAAQFKLEVSAPGDALELEADSAASAMLDGRAARVSSGGGLARQIMRHGIEQTPFHPAPRLPTGIEGTPQQIAADAFLRTVQSDLAAWRSFAGNWRGDLPGGAAAAAALSFERGAIVGPAPDDTGIHGGDPIDQRVRTYLRRHLDSDGLYSLRQLVSMHGGWGGYGALAELFGVPPVTVVHTYVLEMRTTQVRAGAVVNAGVATREMTVRYTNNIGMSYTHRMDGVNLSVGGAAQAEIGRHGVHGAGLGVSVDHDAEESRSEPLHPGYFWAPDWFDGRYASGNTQVGAAGSAAAGNSGANVGGSVGMGQMTFSHGTNDITFFFPPGASGSQGGSRGTGAQHNNVTVGATVDVGVGRALGRGTTGDQPPPPDNPHHLVKQPELTLLLRTRIDFATQSDAIDGVGRNEVEETVRRVREFVQQHPDTDLETSIRSSASRRWRGAETPEQAAELNMVLSQNRAERARVELRGAIERIIGAAPTPHGRYGDEVSVQAMGSEEAALTNAGPDDDSQDFRWVDIEIRRSVYREGEPENPR